MPGSCGLPGLAGAFVLLVAAAQTTGPGCPVPLPAPGAAAARSLMLSGIISQLHDNRLIVVIRSGRPVTIDATPALTAEQSTPLMIGRAVEILGTSGPGGVVRADVIRRIKDNIASWGADCGPVP